MPYRYSGQVLTGLGELKGKHAGGTAVVTCSGTTLARYDDSIPPAEWPRFAVNETIRLLGNAADYWVVSDEPIVMEYAQFLRPRTVVLAMQHATLIVNRWCKANRVFTTESMSKAARYDNGYQFYSRGTVMIGAVEMARWMGLRRLFVFGLDCYRTEDAYYYDGRRPVPLSEKHFGSHSKVRGLPPDQKLYVTPRLQAMIERLDEAARARLWEGTEVWCVASPLSQQRAVPKMDLDVFRSIAREPAAAGEGAQPAAEAGAAGAAPDSTPTQPQTPMTHGAAQASGADAAGAASVPRGAAAPPRRRRRPAAPDIPRGLAKPDTPPERIMPTHVPPEYYEAARRLLDGVPVPAAPDIPRGLATPDTPPERIMPTHVPPEYHEAARRLLDGAPVPEAEEEPPSEDGEGEAWEHSPPSSESPSA